MIVDAAQLPRAAAPPADRNRDRKGTRFAYVFPAVLACLVALVPLVGAAAVAPFLMVLVPLVLWSAFRDTERALYVYFAWCWLDGTIRGLLHAGPVAVVARDIVLGVIVIGWSFQRLQDRHRDPIRYPPGTLLVALFAINCLLQVFNPFSSGLVQSIGGLKMHLSSVPLLFLGYDVIRRPAQVRSFLLFLTLLTLIVGAASYVQYTHGPSWTWAHFPGSQDANAQNLSTAQGEGAGGLIATFKPPGTTTGGGGAGAYVGIIFPLAFVLPLLSGPLRFPKPARAALVAVLLAFLVVIFVNAVRSALVIALCGAVLIGLLAGGKLRARVLAATAVCLVLGGLAYTFSQGVSQGGVTGRFATTFSDPVSALHQDRHTFFDDVGFILVNSPMGIGMGRIGGAAGHLGGGDAGAGFIGFSEAYLGSIIYETGIIGGLLITGIALSFLGCGHALLRRVAGPDDRLLATGMIAVLVLLFANFFVTPVLLGPPGSVLFWLGGGVLLRAFAPATARRVGAAA